MQAGEGIDGQKQAGKIGFVLHIKSIKKGGFGGEKKCVRGCGVGQ